MMLKNFYQETLRQYRKKIKKIDGIDASLNQAI